MERMDRSGSWCALRPDRAFLAYGFYFGELSFDFCDRIVNDIHGVITLGEEERTATFWEVFRAFDEGEYYHRDNPDEDPVEVYTKPQIAQVVSKPRGWDV